MDEHLDLSYKGFLELCLLLFLIKFGISLSLGTVIVLFKINGSDIIARYLGLLGSVLTLAVIMNNFCAKRGFKLEIRYIPTLRDTAVLTGLMIGYSIVFNNTIGLLIAEVEVAGWLLEVIEEMAQVPLILFLEVAIISPILEEVVYRGVFLEYLSRRYGDVKALLITSFVFGLIHFNLHQSVNAFFVGIIMGIIYLKTRSLLYSIAVHVINNTLAVISILSISPEASFETSASFSLRLLVVGTALLGFGLRYIFRFKADDSKRIQINEKWKKYFIQ